MEQRAAEVQARLATVSSFGELVGAMQGVAAARAEHARRRIDGTNTHAQTVADAVAQAMALLPPDHHANPMATGRRPLWVLFCPEQPFNGSLSEQVLAAVPNLAQGRVMLLGAQGVRAAPLRGIYPEWTAPLIAHADAVVPASDRLQTALQQALGREPASEVGLVFAEVGDGHRHQVVSRRLLPLDLEAAPLREGSRPVTHLAPQVLLDQLIDEYLSTRLAHALLHSHCAENLARLQAMAAAHDNVVHLAESLGAQARRLRQEAITEEIMELAAGMQALHRP
ncbi:MAG: F0F1 ATP synthase subunit gamma [Burkholderiaceae bacterium]